jgi:acyl-CoA dehydrogenase
MADAGADLVLLTEAATDLFAKECTPEVVSSAEAVGWAPDLWRALEVSGLSRVGVEASRQEAMAVIRVAARFAAPVPLAETVMAAMVSADPPGDGPLTVACDGRAPYGRVARAIVGVGTFTLEPDVNYAGEPFDRISPPGLDRMLLEGALIRSVQMAGAMDTILAMTVAYAQDRQQFGVPLVRFQAIQHYLALLAEEVTAAGAAADRAVESPTEVNVAAAKVRCGEAAGVSAALAHQIHGAIGFTKEHRLQQFTRRLWAWRDEFGTEAEWAIRLGNLVGSIGPAQFWELTS